MRLIDKDALKEYTKRRLHIDTLDSLYPAEKEIFSFVDRMPIVQCDTCRDYLTKYCSCDSKARPTWVCGDWEKKNDR